jgi:uncharacterized membrane protein YfcA
MAQTRRRRRRKHRGTQSGSIDRRRRARPRTREEAKAQARRRTTDRRDVPPTWGSAFTRGLIGAGIFFVLMMLAFKRPAGEAVALSVVMLAIYVPLGYVVDRFFWRRRQAAKRRQKA